MVYLFLAEGFEEIEALTPVDLLRRAKIDVTTVGIGGRLVTGAHGIKVEADTDESSANAENADIEMVILPGGMPGTKNLDASPTVESFIAAARKKGAPLAAICAAPSVLGKRGLLEGRNAVCYPGFEEYLEGANYINCGVAVSHDTICARAAGSAVEFSYEIIKMLRGEDAANAVLKAIIA